MSIDRNTPDDKLTVSLTGCATTINEAAMQANGMKFPAGEGVMLQFAYQGLTVFLDIALSLRRIAAALERKA